MLSRFKTAIKGLFFTILFYCTFPMVYMFLMPMLMYGDDQVIQGLTASAINLVLIFVVIVALSFWLFIRQAKKSGTYNSFGLLIFYTLLLFISYPLVFLSPFINIHTIGINTTLSGALLTNVWFGCIFLILGIFLDVVKHRINQRATT